MCMKGHLESWRRNHLICFLGVVCFFVVDGFCLPSSKLPWLGGNSTCSMGYIHLQMVVCQLSC